MTHSFRKCAILLALASLCAAQDMLTLRALRLKLSAGDLPSAESLLEVHRASKGEDAEYLLGVAWLARGGALTGDWKSAARYSRLAQELARPRIDAVGFEKASEAVYALGAAIDVEAQRLAVAGNKREALRYLDEQLKAYRESPVAFRSRIHRRWNLIGLEGTRAPDFESTLKPLEGKPVVLFFWAEWCGDCKAQVAALRSAVEKFQPRGVQFLAPTRLYTGDQTQERAKIEQVWRDSYAGLESVRLVISEEAMLRYGASAMPTLVFIDRKGIVRLYSPTRMTTERLSAAIESTLR